MHQPLQIANYFIKKSHSTGTELTPMKLIKLIYISHGWHLGLFSNGLIDEAVRAWKYGPVIDTIYQEFKFFGNGQITELHRDIRAGGYPSVDPGIIPFLDKIWEVYGNYTGIELSTMTHEKGTPWDITWNERGGSNRSGAIIANDLIQDYYKKKAISEASATA